MSSERKSILESYVEKNGTDGLNKGYVEAALKNGGGFGAIAGGIYQAEDGSRYIKPYSMSPTQESLWEKKYQGKTYRELSSTLSGMDKNNAEYKWLEKFAASTKTADDYDIEIADLENQLEQLRKTNYVIYTEDSPELTYRNQDEIKTLEAQLEELKAGKWRAENQHKYANLSANPDYEEKSKAIDESRKYTFGINIGDSYIGFGDPVYTYINDLTGAGKMTASGTKSKFAGPDIGGEGYDPDAPASYLKYSFMTHEEKDNYNYLYQAEGKKAADEYLDYLSYELNNRRAGKYSQGWKEYTDKGFVNGVIGSAASVASNIVSGVGLVDVVGQKLARDITGEYKPIDYNSLAMNPTIATTTIRGNVASNIADATGTININEEEHPLLSRIFNGKSLGDVYQLGMSMADSLAVGYTFGAGGTYLLGGAAGSQGILDALEKGATDDQAIAMGLLNGFFEALFEHVSLDKLLNGNTKGMLKTFLEQGFVEGTEELNTTLFNTVADILVMAENSDYKRSVQAYIEKGYSQQVAERMAMEDIAINMGWDFIGGMLSGGIMGGGKAAINETIIEPHYYSKTYGTGVQELVTESQELNPGNKTAQKAQERIDSGKKVSGRDIRTIVNQNDATMLANDKASIQTAVEEQLRKYGETGNIKEISKAITKFVSGEQITAGESQLIKGSKYGQRVVNELNPENIRSGGYSSAWAENLGTNRINPDEYNRIVEDAQIKENSADVEAAVEAEVQRVQQKQQATAQENKTVQEPAVESTVADDNNVVTTDTGKTASIESASKKYGKQAGAFVSTYQQGQDVAKYDEAYKAAFNYGMASVPFETIKGLDSVSYLTEKQRQLAYNSGADASNANAVLLDAENKAAAKNTGEKWNAGTVKYDGTYKGKGTVKGVAVKVKDISETFNDTQKIAYRVLSRIAEATGINIVLYKSEAGADGKFRASQGDFKRGDPGTIYIDLNAGLLSVNDVTDLGKYTMLYTFSHEFVHFIEKWNPVKYNELRKTVFAEMTKNGNDVDLLIRAKLNGELSYDEASREVVAESLTEVLPQASFVETLYNEHKGLFDQLLDKLKQFVEDIKAYFSANGSNVRNNDVVALKSNIDVAVKYAENVIDIFNNVAKQAVENYQMSLESTETAETVESSATETVTETVSEPASETKKAQVETKPEPKTDAESINDAEEQPETVEAIPAKTETEEAKAELRKAVRMPIKGTNMEALLQGITSKELSMESITLPGKVEGFNSIQREYLVEALIKGVYTDKEKISVAVPYDGKFEIENTPGNVAKVLDSLNVKVTQEILFDKNTVNALKKDGRLIVLSWDGKFYATNGYLVLPTTPEGANYLIYEHNAERKISNASVDGLLTSATKRITSAPVGGKLGGKKAAYEFNIDGTKRYFDKSAFKFIDGGTLYISADGRIIKSVDENGELIGFLMGINAKTTEFTERAPAKLKSFAKQSPAAATKETSSTTEIRESAPTKVEEIKTPKTRFMSLQMKNGTPSEKTAYRILTEHLRVGKQLTSKELYAICDEAFGGTQAEGTYDRKDAYDAMELAVNKYLVEVMGKYNTGTVENALEGLKRMQSILELLPTQNVRTEEQQQYQQFSTPPNIAYLAAWTANITSTDSVLEPSAGIGGLASFAKAWGATVTVNELSKRRLEVLKAMGFDNVFNENAEHIDDILPDRIKPSVVIMNPPFSSTAGRTKNNKTSNAELHINQALERLADGGRLVTVLGRGMSDSTYYKYWDKLREDYNIRANISIDGENYKKYGTTFDVQIVVIDKTGPQGEEKTLTGSFTDLSKIPEILEVIRNDRNSEVKRNTVVESAQVNNVPVSDKGNQPVSVPVDQTNNSTDRSMERGDQSDTGRTGEPGITDIQPGEQETVSAAQRDDKPGVRADRTTRTGKENTKSKSRGGAVSTVSDVAGNVDSKRTFERSRSDTEPTQSGQVEEGRSKERNDDGVFADYVAPAITISGSEPHPAVLVESSAMSAVSMPKATYVPHLPENVVKNNLSTEQLVSITYAGQAHEQKLPSGERKGFFIGDGTGVGKGRQISGIILDNFEQGRKKAVWVSMNASLYPDAVRDWTDTTGRSKDEVHDFSKVKLQDKIDYTDGILYTTYDTLRTEKGNLSRLNQIVEWLGKDFDGVIAFDEAHNMGNLLGKSSGRGKSKGSAKAAAAVALQSMLPNARVVYVSATAATEVEGLAFASRLGLWGRGTAFQDVNDFISNIGSSGLAAMELVIRDMKAMGVYVARSISYNGVNYDTVQHNLDPMQTIIYDTMSEAWQKTMTNVEASLESTGGKYNSNARALAIGQYYSAMQRFYNQVLTSMSMPSVIADMKKELAAGRSCVLQIVNTNQAEADRQIADIKANGGNLDDMDLTPRGTLIGYLENCYPVNKYEEYTDDQGNLRSRLVVDSQGNPVIDKAAVRKRDALIEEIQQMSIPDGPLEMLFNAFGTDNVSEITGRTRRVVPRKMPDGTIQRVEESRTKNSTAADVEAFQNGKKRILIFSDAGGTGKSYHASRTAKNQQQRVHYVLQPGWIASKAVQGFGRTHRSNQASAPIYKLVTTNIKGQKRFTSTIARRLDQLGALTKGQRDTGSGMFGPKDNLETDLARDSLREFYRRLGKNQIEGLDGKLTIQRLGLTSKFTDQYGAFKLDDATSRDISTFLNRILALKVEEQNTVFDAFINIYETLLEEAINAGTLDTGMENVKADKIEIIDDKVIKEQESTGATTHYVQAKVYTKPKLITTVDQASKFRGGFVGIYKTKAGDIKAVYRIADKTTEWGAVEKQYRLCGPNYTKYSIWKGSTFDKNAELVPKENWQAEWDKEMAKVPEYNEEIKHMLTGTLLPIWNALPTDGNTKVQRLISDDGRAYLGRVINQDQIDDVLKRFNLNRTKESFTAQGVMDDAIKKGVRYKLSYQRAEIFRSRVSGEWRLEYRQPQNSWAIKRQYPDMMSERISYQDRYFIPLNDKGAAILEKILTDNPVSSTSEDIDDGTQYQSREYLDDVYPTEGVHWGVEAGIITKKEVRAVWEAIANKSKRGYYYPKTISGEIFVDSGNYLMVVNPDYSKPIIRRIYEFDELYETNHGYAKGVIIRAKGNPAWNRDALRTIENAFGTGYVTEYDVRDYSTIAGKIRAGEGSDSRATDSELQYQDRTSPLTDREVLSIAASEVNVDGLDAGELDALRIFQQRLESLYELEQKRVEEGQTYREQQFGQNVDREAAKQTLNRMKVLDEKISKASAEVLKVEKTEVLKRVLQKSRKVVEAKERKHGQELLRRERDRRNNAAAIKKYRTRIQTDVDTLSKWIIHPNNKNAYQHVPDALKNSIIPLLTSIDFTSKRKLRGGAATKADAEFMKNLNKLKSAIKQNIDVQGMYSGYSDLPEGFMDEMQKFIDSAQALADSKEGQFVINRMTSEELKTLSKLIRVVKKLIINMNAYHQNAMFQHTYEGGDNSIEFMSQLENSKGTGAVSEFLLWQQIRPAYAFERFGKGGEAIYDEFRRAQATLAFNTVKIKEFAEKTYTSEEAKAWEKEIKTFTLGGDTVKIPTSYVMGLYELSKRPQALTHILGAGVRVATYKNGKEKISDVGHALTPSDVTTIINSLSDRQKQVADALQQFMAKQGGEWGNYVSVARFGEELFGEEHYYPINSDGRHLQATADEHPSAASLYALLNMSFTKELQENANNRLILYSIFDVFANHMASMAQYNAFALPILDSLKWFNYQQVELDENGGKRIIGSVREQMARAYGVPEETKPGRGRQGYAETFVMNIIKAFNGTETQGVPTDAQGLNAMHKYNMAQVAYNLRVVIQQPLAITRAGMLIDYSSIIKQMSLSPATIKANIAEMQKYSGIAAWKNLGFYDINISRGLTDIIKHKNSFMDKVGDVGMMGAEFADQITWAGIWAACKEQVMKEQKLKPSDEGFFDAVTKLFEDVIYKTQVVDSVLTKNEFLRSKGAWARLIGSFMSEPTTTASMLIDAFDKFSLDMQRGMTRQQAWKKNEKNIVRTAYVYGIGSIVMAVATAIADAWRDDDDYQTFLEKWLEAFGGNLVDEAMPFNKLPILRDFYELAKSLLDAWGVDTYGNEPRSVIFQWRDSLVKGNEIIHDLITGNDTNYEWYAGIYKLLQAISGISGLPMAAAVREINTAWNNTIGAMAPSLKIKSYDAGPKNNIKYSYQDGWLTDDEAMSLLIEKGFAADEDDAYWMVQEWAHTKNNSDWTRFDEIYKAMLADDKAAFADAQEALGDHGITPSNVRNEAKKQIKRWYQGTDGEGQQMDKQTAIRALQTYAGMSRMAAEHDVDEWSSYVVTGIAYEDISEEFIKGNITAYRAQEMLVKYGHLYDRDAAEKVNQWQMEKDTGIPYSKLNDAYIHNDVTEHQAIDYLMQYGQLTREEAEDKILDWQAARDYGVTLGSTTEGIKKALIEGYISAETAKTIMMVYDGKTAEEAEDYVNQYRFTAETGYSFSEIVDAYADGAISRDEMIMWYQDASLYTHGSWEIAEEYATVADWKVYVPYGESMNRDGLEKWEKYGYNVTRAGLGKSDFARAWGLYNDSESQYDSKGNKTKEKAQVFFEKLYDLYLQGVYSIKEINGIAYSVYSSKYVRTYKVW